jgi:hypothetical protein
VLKINASDFTRAISLLQRVQALIGTGAGHNDATVLTEKPVSKTVKEGSERHLNSLIEAIVPIGMPLSVKSIGRMKDGLQRDKFTFSEMRSAYAEIEGRIYDELDLMSWFCIDKRKADFYEPAAPLFGAEVDLKFPSAKYEIEEAGNCLALRRSTACVMHLMRVLEVGIQAVAEDLGVTAQDTSALLDQIERVIPEVILRRNSPEDEQWLSEATAHFRLLKDTWGDYAMHVHETYNEEQAEVIFEQTRICMQHLATRLADPQGKLLRLCGLTASYVPGKSQL